MLTSEIGVQQKPKMILQAFVSKVIIIEKVLEERQTLLHGWLLWRKAYRPIESTCTRIIIESDCKFVDDSKLDNSTIT